MRALVVLLGVALALGTAASAQRTPARMIDRTFVCTAAMAGGVHQFEARAHRGTGRRGSSWQRPAFAAISTSIAGSVADSLKDEIVWMIGGRPAAEATLDSEWTLAHFPVRGWGTLAVSRLLCRASSARVAVSSRGLAARTIGSFADRYDCQGQRRILVRIRTIAQSPTALKAVRGFLRTTVPLRRAELMVRAVSGTPLVYAQVLESGKSILYTAPSCFPD